MTQLGHVASSFLFISRFTKSWSLNRVTKLMGKTSPRPEKVKRNINIKHNNHEMFEKLLFLDNIMKRCWNSLAQLPSLTLLLSQVQNIYSILPSWQSCFRCSLDMSSLHVVGGVMSHSSSRLCTFGTSKRFYPRSHSHIQHIAISYTHMGSILKYQTSCFL